MPTPTASALERLRAALEAGPTPGPWHWDSDPYVEGSVSFQVVALGRTIAQTYYSSRDPQAQKDTAFIAADNPEAIRTLLSAIDAKDAEIARLRQALDNVFGLVVDRQYLFNDTEHEILSEARAALNAKETP